MQQKLKRLLEEEDARRASARERKYGTRNGGSARSRTDGSRADGYGRGSDFLGFYKMLGLEDTMHHSSEDEIKEAFRSKALKVHPDLFLSESAKRQAEEDFKKLQKAYQVLRDPEQRLMYHNGQLR